MDYSPDISPVNSLYTHADRNIFFFFCIFFLTFKLFYRFPLWQFSQYLMAFDGNQTNILPPVNIPFTYLINFYVILFFGSLWGGSVINLGTKKHKDKYFDKIDKLEYPGCFAMTELHHGEFFTWCLYA